MNDELQVSFEELEAQEQALRREMSLDEDMRTTQQSAPMSKFIMELRAGMCDPPRHLLPLALGTLKVSVTLRVIQRCKSCESVTVRFGTGRQKMIERLDKSQTSASCVYM